MKKTAVCTPIIMFLLLSLALHGVQLVGFASAAQESSPDKHLAIIKIVSPVDNGSYDGDVSLNISITVYVASRELNSSMTIPYRDIGCIYQLDSNEWKTASLHSMSEQKARYSWVGGANTTWIDGYYSSLMQDLSNGVHVLNVTLKTC